MAFLLWWFFVSALDLIVWVASRRIYLLRRRIDAISLRRPSDEHSRSSFPFSVLKRPKKHYAKLLAYDDRNISGFTPPRVTRSIIATLILIQNLIAILIATIPSGRSLDRICIRAGDLALGNLILLIMLMFSGWALNRLVSQSEAQLMWIHAFLGWLVWYEALLHSVASISQVSHLVHYQTQNIPFILLASLIIVVLVFYRFTRAETLKKEMGVRDSGIARVIPQVDMINNNELAYYFKVNKIPWRTAWYERDHGSQYHRPILLLTTSSSLGTSEIEGPFPIPHSPYATMPRKLDIAVSDSGLFEAFTCFCRRNSLGYETRMTWYNVQDGLRKMFLAHISDHFHAQNHRSVIEIIYFGAASKEFGGEIGMMKTLGQATRVELIEIDGPEQDLQDLLRQKPLQLQTSTCGG
ncbi:hypothetical protein EDB80DRAFT_692311 [Ilyonectria destructans]|nr:hypothetical protein EDB80DRAFT_692311 [Ilyonectria destructans]